MSACYSQLGEKRPNKDEHNAGSCLGFVFANCLDRLCQKGDQAEQHGKDKRLKSNGKGTIDIIAEGNGLLADN